MTPDKEKRIWTQVGEEAHVRCDCCGHTRKMVRGEPFRCWFCGNEPEEVLIGSGTGFILLMDEMPFQPWNR